MDWCEKWQLPLDPSKLVCMTITHKLNPLNFYYKLHNVPLVKVREYEYLGVTITSNLTWTNHVNNIVGKANKRLGYIRGTLKRASPETRLTAYKLLVRPIWEYACEVWDPHVKKLASKLENVQRRALRFTYSRYCRQDAVSSLYMKSNLQLQQLRRKHKRLSLFYSTVNNQVLVEKPQYIKDDTSRIKRNKHSRYISEIRFKKDFQIFLLRLQRAWLEQIARKCCKRHNT